jgi:hypothetical protein
MVRVLFKMAVLDGEDVGARAAARRGWSEAGRDRRAGESRRTAVVRRGVEGSGWVPLETYHAHAKREVERQRVAVALELGGARARKALRMRARERTRCR